jgi:ADP-Ribosyltransferase in polyvalent proteins
VAPTNSALGTLQDLATASYDLIRHPFGGEAPPAPTPPAPPAGTIPPVAPRTQEDVKAKYDLPATADITKPYFDPANKDVKDADAFSRASQEFNPPPAKPSFARRALDLTGVTDIHGAEGGLAPRTVEETVSPLEWIAGETAMEAAAPYLNKVVGPVVSDVADRVSAWRQARDAATGFEGRTINLQPSEYNFSDIGGTEVAPPQKALPVAPSAIPASSNQSVLPAESAEKPRFLAPTENEPPEGYIRVYRGINPERNAIAAKDPTHGNWYTTHYDDAVSYANWDYDGTGELGPKRAIRAVDIPLEDAFDYAQAGSRRRISSPEELLDPERPIEMYVDDDVAAGSKHYEGDEAESEKGTKSAVPVTTPAQPETKYIYHATNTENAADIAEQGLKTHKPWEGTDQSTWPDRSVEKRAYFAGSPEVALNFAPEEGKSVVLRMEYDPNLHKVESGTGDFYTKKVIPPEKLEIRNPDGSWRLLTSEPPKPVDFSEVGGTQIKPGGGFSGALNEGSKAANTPEWVAGEYSHEINRLENVLRNPDATAEDKAIAGHMLQSTREQAEAGLSPVVQKTATPENVEEFKNWFGKSKIVDDGGQPAVAYHGTTSPVDFEEFSTSGPPHDEEGNELISSSGSPNAYMGAHFAIGKNGAAVANKFAENKEGWMRSRYEGEEPKPRVIPVHLKLENPINFKSEVELDNFIHQGHISDERLLNEAAKADGIEEPEEGGKEIEAWQHRYNTDPHFRAEQNAWILRQSPSQLGYEETNPINDAAAELGQEAQRRLKEQGHDGAIYKNAVEGGKAAIAFEPGQIRHAIPNKEIASKALRPPLESEEVESRIHDLAKQAGLQYKGSMEGKSGEIYHTFDDPAKPGDQINVKHSELPAENVPQFLQNKMAAKRAEKGSTGETVEQMRQRILAEHGLGSAPAAKPAWWNEPSDNAFARGMTKGEETTDWFTRHQVPQENGKYVLYHATPEEGGATTSLRAGSYLAEDPETAVHQASRERGPKAGPIKVTRVLVNPEDIKPGVWASLRNDHPITQWDKTVPAQKFDISSGVQKSAPATQPLQPREPEQKDIVGDVRGDIHHEMGHSLVGDYFGVPTLSGIWTGRHPDVSGVAGMEYDFSVWPDANPDGSLSRKATENHIGELLPMYMGGGAGEELTGGVRMADNTGMRTDRKTMERVLITFGYSPEQAQIRIRAAEEEAKRILTEAAAPDIMKRYSSAREEGLPDTHHMSQERVEELQQEVRNATQGNNAKGNAPATAKNSGANDAGGKSTNARELGQGSAAAEEIKNAKQKAGQGGTDLGTTGTATDTGRGTDVARREGGGAQGQPGAKKLNLSGLTKRGASVK